jgi:hypothetical protein
MPPIERVQGPYIKGVRCCAGLHKKARKKKVNWIHQELPIETTV